MQLEALRACKGRSLWLTVFLAGSVAGQTGELAPAPPPPAAPRAIVFRRPVLQLTPAQLDRLRRALAPFDDQYDPVEQMLRQPFSSPGYHTTLTSGFVHSTRASLDYAVALLDTGDADRLRRAVAILRRVIALQDDNPTHKTYGIWSWFLEEPLDKMSPPDWNWADFCGVELLQVALDHRERLPSDLKAQLDAAIQRAARSIQRRDVGPAYTNIAIMGTYVTLVAAELYGLPDLREYALARWRRFYDYTLKNGGFTEYNSPTYTVVALKELARLRRDVRDPEARRMTETVYRLAWEDIARHFHPPTRQWAGPHSRCYHTLLRPDVLALIQQATSGRVVFGAAAPSLDEGRLPVACPDDLESSFTALSVPREFHEVFVKSEPPVVGTTRLEPAFALGSVNRGDLWNQRRPLVAYWGAADHPSCLALRFLHDDYDFADAQFFSVQQGGDVLTGINFAVDGGDRHPSLDRIKNATIRAKDLRVRFEFGGGAGRSQLEIPRSLGQPAKLRFGDLHVQLAVPRAIFAHRIGTWQTGGDGETTWLDVVLYSGPERTFTLTDLDEAVVGLAVRLTARDDPGPSVSATVRDDQFEMKWGRLRLGLPTRPGPAAVLQRAFHAAVGE